MNALPIVVSGCKLSRAICEKTVPVAEFSGSPLIYALQSSHSKPVGALDHIARVSLWSPWNGCGEFTGREKGIDDVGPTSNDGVCSD